MADYVGRHRAPETGHSHFRTVPGSEYPQHKGRHRRTPEIELAVSAGPIRGHRRGIKLDVAEPVAKRGYTPQHTRSAKSADKRAKANAKDVDRRVVNPVERALVQLWRLGKA